MNYTVRNTDFSKLNTIKNSDTTVSSHAMIQKNTSFSKSSFIKTVNSIQSNKTLFI